MRINLLDAVEIKKPFWLLTIGAGLVIFNLHLYWFKHQTLNFPIESVILWIASTVVIWKKKYNLNLESGVFATACGIIILAWMVIRNLLTRYSTDDILNYCAPLFISVGFLLIAYGFEGFKHHYKETLGILLSFLPLELFLKLSVFTLIDAKIAHYILWYIGFDARRQGTQVILNQTGIDIHAGCSSLVALLILLKISVAFFMIFSMSNNKKIGIILAAIIISFVMNGFRLCLLALLVAQNNKAGFDYWHIGLGTQIFSTAIIILFGWFCNWIMEKQQLADEK